MNGRGGNGGSNASRILAILAGMLIGGLAGAVAMFLLAPGSGEKSRSQMLKQCEKMRKQVVSTMDDVVTGAGDKASQFTDGVQRGVADMQEHAQDLLSQARNN